MERRKQNSFKWLLLWIWLNKISNLIPFTVELECYRDLELRAEYMKASAELRKWRVWIGLNWNWIFITVKTIEYELNPEIWDFFPKEYVVRQFDIQSLESMKTRVDVKGIYL